MERHVKERLIGAAVLVAAAIILVPEMLSGPERLPSATDVPTSESIKTYSVDLKATSVFAPPAPAAATAAPASDEASVADSETPSPPPAETQASASASETKRPVGPPSEDSQVTTPAPLSPTPPKAATPVPKSPSAPAESKPTARSGAWAVQVGSFSTQAKASGVAHELEKQGFSAFVRSATLNGRVLYRVRVGPMSDRVAAEATLAKVKARNPGASVVPQ